MIWTYAKVDKEKVAHDKLKKLVQKGSIESYAQDFHTLCAEIVTILPLSIGDKILRSQTKYSFARGN